MVVKKKILVDDSAYPVSRIMQEARKEYGQEVMKLGSENPPLLHIPTGIFTLDMALLGGIPRSQITLVYGKEGSGKSTLAQKIAAQAQRLLPDQNVGYVDIEGTFDPTWGACHGVDNDRLIVVQPHTGEQALDIAESLIHATDISLLVVDSLAALVSFREIERSIEDDLPGIQARMISKYIKKSTAALIRARSKGSKVAIIWINQWRFKIGVFRGDPRVLPGGQHQHYAAFAKVEIYNKEIPGKDANDFDTVDHNDHSFKVAKSKIGVALRSGEFTMIRNPDHPMGQGFIDDGKTVATWAKKLGVITGSGGGYQLRGVDESFRTLDEITTWFYADLDRFEAFKRMVIGEYRVTCGRDAGGWL